MKAKSGQNYTVIKAVTIALVGFVILLVIALGINLVRLSGLRKAEDEAKKNLAAAIALSQELEDELAYKRSAEYIERYARILLNMKYKGEKILSGKEP